MVFKGRKKFVTAQHMADQVKTEKRAISRIRVLRRMIEDEEKDIETARITILKHQKEIKLLEKKFELVGDDNVKPDKV